MKLDELTDLYNLISEGIQNIPSRKRALLLRKSFFNSGTGFQKVAFDTRRINQETDYIPRRGLQNYHRSEKFITDSLAIKIEGFSKLGKVLEKLKIKYGRSPEWQDSYTRVLTSAVSKGLRSEQADGDYSEVQPSMASLDYLTELLDVRYRLTMDNLNSMSEEELIKSILNKDPILVAGAPSEPYLVKPSDVSKYSYDHMMEKMMSTMAQVMSSYKPPSPEDTLTSKLFDVKATSDMPEIERTVTITIKDKIVDKFEKKAKEYTEEQEKLQKNSNTNDVIVE